MAKNQTPAAPSETAPSAAPAKDRGKPVTIHLSRDAFRKLKHAAIDEDVSTSKLVERIVTQFLA